eukprot:gene3170-3698_t
MRNTLISREVTYLVRLVTYIPGTVFAQVEPKTDRLFRSLGHFTALLDDAFSAIELPPVPRPDLVWDLSNLGELV